jgi:hypothetical protein
MIGLLVDGKTVRGEASAQALSGEQVLLGKIISIKNIKLARITYANQATLAQMSALLNFAVYFLYERFASPKDMPLISN